MAPSVCCFTQLSFGPLPTICKVLCRTSWVMALKVGHFTTMSNLHFPIHQLNLSEPFLLLLGYAILTKSFSLKAMRLFFPQLLSIRILFNPIKKCYCNHSWNRKGASLFWVLDSGAASLLSHLSLSHCKDEVLKFKNLELYLPFVQVNIIMNTLRLRGSSQFC